MSSDSASSEQGPAAREHYDKAIIKAVVEAVRNNMGDGKWDQLKAGRQVRHKRGCAGDDELSLARAAFARAMSDHPQFDRVTPKVFVDLARRWGPRYHATGENGIKTVRVREARLSTDDLETAATILGTPYNDDEDDPHYWRSAYDCLNTEHPQKAQFKGIFEKSRLRTSAGFEKMLLAKCSHIIVKKKADIREKLAKDTAKSRKDCSDVWGHRKAWRTLKRTRAEREGEGVRARAAEEEETEQEVMWDWHYYKNYTFMIDATSFDDKPITRRNYQRAIMLKNLVHPPEVEKAPPSLNNATTIMVYTIIHPHLGVVLGPEVMYTGSTTKPGNNQGAKNRHDPEFPYWCASLTRILNWSCNRT